MGNCKYKLNINNSEILFKSDEELTSYLLNNNVKSGEAIKYSFDLSERQKQITSAINNAVTDARYGNSKAQSTINYLAAEHNINGKNKLLTPDFDTENYLKNAVNKKIEDLIKSNSITEDQIDSYKDSIRKELEAELDEDNIMRKNSMAIHELVSTVIKTSIISQEVVTAINNFIDSVDRFTNNNKLTYSNEQKANYYKIIYSELVKFNTAINSLGNTIISKPNLISEDALSVKDRPDFVVVDSNGNAHIVDVTFSRKSLSDWDSSKRLSQDYKLGIQRQLLESHVPTNRSGLYIAPFIMPSMDLENFSFSSLSDRVSENRSLDFYAGDISKTLKTLLPTKFTKLHIQNDNLSKNSEDLISAILPTSYVIRSKFAIEDKESLLKKIKEKKEEGEPYKYNNTLINKVIKCATEQELNDSIDKYIKEYNADKHSEVFKLSRQIKLSIKDQLGYIDFGKDSSKDIINKSLEKYLKGDWEFLDNDIFLNQGLLVFKNNNYKTIEVVSVTTNNLSPVRNLGLGNTLLGKFRNNNDASKDSRIQPASVTNIEIIRTLALLNNIPELFSNYTLSNIKVLNYRDVQSDYANLNDIIHNFNQLFAIANSKDKLPVKNNFENNTIKRSDEFEELYGEILSHLTSSSNPQLKELGKGAREDIKDAELNWLIKIQKRLLSFYPSLNKSAEIVSDFDTPEKQLLKLVSDGILFYSKIKLSFDYNVPQYGVKLSDIMHPLHTLWTGESREFDAKNNRIAGIFQGSYFRTTDDMLSEDITKLHDLISLAHSKVRDAYAKIQNKITNKTNEYYKACNRSGLEKILLGMANPYHSVLLETKENSKDLSTQFIYKDPYNMNVNLKDHERDYLKFILWETYKFKKAIGSEFFDMDYKDAEKHEKFKEFLNDDAYLQVPLMKKMDLSKWGTLTTDTLRQTIGKRWEEFKDTLDPRNVTELQRKSSEDQINASYTMYNEFNIAPEFREKLINEYGVNYFEVNQDTLALKFAFSSIRENVMNQILPIINAATTVIKYHGQQSGDSESVKKAMDDFYKQLRISVYGASPIKGEIAEPIAAIKKVQQIASIMFITMRPALMFKELITGTIKNVSYAWTKVYGDSSFTQADLTAAYGKVLFSKAQSPVDFTIVDNLNIRYGIANMDINGIVKKSKTDRLGIFKFFSDNLYWMNSAPDYVNRLTLFVAKMIHDGCYDAHYIDKNGEFIYDPTKDKRFEVYFKKRKQYDFKFAQNDKDYNDQRSLYLSMLSDFNEENVKMGMTVLDEKKDLIPKAYTQKERESIKVFSDMAYGFYDHERSALWKHTAFGSIFGQFLTFWPSKVKYYFGKESKSKYGQYEQKYILDENGEKKFIWRKELKDEDGNLIGMEDTFENTGIKATHFMGSTYEGLMYSLGLTLRDIKNGNFDKTPKERKRRAMLAIHDLFMMLIAMLIARTLLEDFPDTEKMTYSDQAKQVTTKAVYKALNEFNPYESVFNSFRWEPAFAGMLGNMYDAFTGVFTGDTDLDKFFRRNFKMLEIIPRIKE